MFVQLSAPQVASLNDTLQEFNRVSGMDWNEGQFFHYVLNEALISNAETAALSRAIHDAGIELVY